MLPQLSLVSSAAFRGWRARFWSLNHRIHNFLISAKVKGCKRSCFCTSTFFSKIEQFNKKGTLLTFWRFQLGISVLPAWRISYWGFRHHTTFCDEQILQERNFSTNRCFQLEQKRFSTLKDISSATIHIFVFRLFLILIKTSTIFLHN